MSKKVRKQSILSKFDNEEEMLDKEPSDTHLEEKNMVDEGCPND